MRGHGRRYLLTDLCLVAGEMKVRDVFGAHYEKLQRLKGKFDPGLVFDKMHPIQPVIEG